MKKNVFVIIALFLLSFSSFTITAQPPEWSEITGLSYSDKIVPGTEISWELTTWDIANPAAEDWEIYPGHVITDGDVFKLNVTKDPDEMGLTHPANLYTGFESWSDFYVNDIFITDNVTNVNWRNWTRDERLYAGFIVPTTISFASGEVNYFDYLYDYYSELEYGEGGSLRIKLTDTMFTIEEHFEGSSGVILSGGGAGLGSTYPSEKPTLDQITETPDNYDSKITYNIEWGAIVLIDLKVRDFYGKSRVVLETGIGEIAVPYEWIYGLFALLIMGLVTIRKKK